MGADPGPKGGNVEVFKIKHRFTRKILFQKECESFKECVEAACVCNLDFSFSDLSCCALYYSNLIVTNFTGCDFRCSDFKYVNFTGCNFTDCNLIGCDFSWCNFNHSIFKNTIITEEGDVINEIPIQITGLKWTVTIFDQHMKIGCELHKFSDWESFSDERINDINLSALTFWKKNKQFLLSACANNGRG